MPSARASQFKGGGGILRRKDAVIVGIQFTDKNPLWQDKPKPAAKPGEKQSNFHTLFAVLAIQEDGREGITQQPLFVGDADAFEVVLDGQGVKGEGQFSKSSDWYLFLESLSSPTDGGDGFDEARFPEDPEGLVADYRPLIGARVMFDWRKNDKKTKSLGQRVVKGKDGKPDQKFDREDLVVAQYYGQVEVKPGQSVKQAGAGKTTQAAAVSAKTGVAPAADVVASTATGKILAELAASKNKALSPNKLSVKLLTALASETVELREAVRTWALDEKNLATVPGTKMVDGKLTLNADDDDE